jgi:hypothetical protein
MVVASLNRARLFTFYPEIILLSFLSLLISDMIAWGTTGCHFLGILISDRHYISTSNACPYQCFFLKTNEFESTDIFL